MCLPCSVVAGLLHCVQAPAIASLAVSLGHNRSSRWAVAFPPRPAVHIAIRQQSAGLRQTAVDMPPSVMLQLGELMQLQWSPDSASLILLAWMCQTSPGQDLSCVSSSVVHFK